MTQPDDHAPETAALSASSQRQLASGQLPLEAQRRLSQETGGRRFFATDLSVGELLLVEAEGYDALGVVMGSSIYHVGWQYTYAYGSVSRELETVTAAHLHARELAIGRMEQEAAALGAEGVVGVRFTIRPYENNRDMLEFTAIGTAVRRRVPTGPPPERPFASDLSGEDFWTLRQAGYEPRGLAMGFSSFFVIPMVRPYVAGSLYWYGNLEMPAFSEGVYRARALAMQRLEGDLRRLGAEGVTATRLDVQRRLGEREYNNTTYLSLQVDFFVMGTAVRRMAEAVSRPAPSIALNMTGLRPVRPPTAGAPREFRYTEG